MDLGPGELDRAAGDQVVGVQVVEFWATAQVRAADRASADREAGDRVAEDQVVGVQVVAFWAAQVQAADRALADRVAVVQR